MKKQKEQGKNQSSRQEKIERKKKEGPDKHQYGEGSRAGDNYGQKGEEIGTQMSGGDKEWKR